MQSENQTGNSSQLEHARRAFELKQGNREKEASRGAVWAAGESICDSAFWFELIDEVQAAGFLGLDRRSMQKFRQAGGGPLYVSISSRCVRYRRRDLNSWVEERLRKSTSDPGSNSPP